VTAAVVYRRHELGEIQWTECPACAETVVQARTPDGLRRLDTVPDGGAPGEPGYEEHECPAVRG
jgi:hypothetical protein